MVVVPTPITVTVRPDIVATDVSLLVNVKFPVLFDEGSVRLNDTSPKTLLSMVYGWNVGVGISINGIVPLLLAVPPDADCVNAIVVEPEDLGRIILPHISAIALLLIENV